MNERSLALVGGGYWGKNLARNFDAIDALGVLCDVNASTLESYGDSYPLARRTTLFQSVLESSDIKRIAIATPAVTHFSLAKSALLAGKDVYVEKPLCLIEDEASELVAIASQNKRILMVGHLLHYHACIRKIKELIADGKLGKLLYITSNRLNLGKIRREENALWSFAPHDISVILALTNELPSEVRCSGHSFLTEGVADTTLTQLDFPSGISGHIHVSWLNPFKEQKLTIVGSKAMVVFDDTLDWENKLKIYEDYLQWSAGNVPVPSKAAGIPLDVSYCEPLQAECTHFVECCDQRKTPITDGHEGLRVLQVLQAAQKSLDSGKSEKLAANRGKTQPEYFSHETSIVDVGAQVGARTHIWHYSHISSNAIIGEDCNLGQNVYIASDVTIGRSVKVQNNVSIYSGTTIDDFVFLGPSCVLTNVTNPRSEVVRRGLYETTHLGRGATIGANATIVCGVKVGRYAFVAAGAVVSSDVQDYELVMGVPARRAGWMSRHGHPLHFDDHGTATCPETGFRYQRDRKDRVVCLDCSEDTNLRPELTVGHKSYNEFNTRT